MDGTCAKCSENKNAGNYKIVTGPGGKGVQRGTSSERYLSKEFPARHLWIRLKNIDHVKVVIALISLERSSWCHDMSLSLNQGVILQIDLPLVLS